MEESSNKKIIVICGSNFLEQFEEAIMNNIKDEIILIDDKKQVEEFKDVIESSYIPKTEPILLVNPYANLNNNNSNKKKTKERIRNKFAR